MRILDVGGGNGKFVDALAQRLDASAAVNVDVSSELLARNVPMAGKRLVNASVFDLDQVFPAHEKFDFISLNWILHHLVSLTETETKALQTMALETCGRLLSNAGCILVSENDYRSWFGGGFSARLIYWITRSKLLQPLTRRHANTAGVGVRFRPATQWRKLALSLGYEVENEFYGANWRVGLSKRLVLGMRAPRHVHFLLRRKIAPSV